MPASRSRLQFKRTNNKWPHFASIGLKMITILTRAQKCASRSQNALQNLFVVRTRRSTMLPRLRIVNQGHGVPHSFCPCSSNFAHNFHELRYRNTPKPDPRPKAFPCWISPNRCRSPSSFACWQPLSYFVLLCQSTQSCQSPTTKTWHLALVSAVGPATHTPVVPYLASSSSATEAGAAATDRNPSTATTDAFEVHDFLKSF